LKLALSRVSTQTVNKSLPLARFCTHSQGNNNPLTQTTSPKLIDVNQFHKWCSAFTAFEEKELNVRFEVSNDIKKVQLDLDTKLSVPPQLLLKDVTQTELLAGEYANLPDPKDDSKAVARIIRDVLLNNYVDTEAPKDEVRVDVLAGKILDRLSFDRAGLYTRPKPNLDLMVACLPFACRCDFVIGLEDYIDLRVAIVEDKHALSSHYRKGLLQAFCSMVAAVQRCSVPRDIVPMYGIRIVGDCFTILYCDIPMDYARAVEEGYSPKELTVQCYPLESEDKVGDKKQTKHGLRFSVPEDRALILQLLQQIRAKVVKK